MVTRMRGIFWVASGAALWGTDTILRRPLSATLSPVQLVFYEHIILACIALPILVRSRAYFSKLTFRSWMAVAAISGLGSALGTILFTYAVQSGSPTTAVLLQKVQPVFAIFLAHILLKERWPRHFPFIVMIAIGGAYLISFGGGSLLSPWTSVDRTAAIFAVGAAAAWGCSTVFGRYLSTQVPFEMVTALRIVCALPFLIIAVLNTQSAPMQAEALLPLVLLALIPGFAGLMLYYRGLSSTSASQASLAELAYPATAALLNWILLGVPTSLLQVIGLGIVWCAIFSLRRQTPA